MVIEAVAVTIAMYCLIQFYIQIRLDIKQHSPLLKIAAIKLVIFLSFWQTIVLSFLTSSGAIKANDQLQTPDIKVGLPSMLLCIEMALFSVFHMWAFSWKPYVLGSKQFMAKSVPGEDVNAQHYKGGFLGIKAMVDSFNLWDMIKATGRSAKWLFRGRKHRHHDPSYDLSRKTATGSLTDPEGQNLASFSTPTAYTGPGRPPHYTVGDAGEGETLLSNSQPMPRSQPPFVRRDTDPERIYYDPGDIGVASTTDNKTYQQSSHPNAYQPYLTTTGQESGFIHVPYPDQQRERGRENRVSMPYMPPSRSPDSRGRGHGNQGNFL
jgi:hypothetical protein